MRTQGDASHEEAMIDLIGILLDRYGIIAPNTVSDAGVAGGFSAIYPVLKRMEEKGTLLRGVFVKGFGAAQFAERETAPAASPYRFRACHDRHHGCMRSGESLWFVIGMAGAGHT